MDCDVTQQNKNLIFASRHLTLTNPLRFIFPPAKNALFYYFSINGKRRHIPILLYQNHKNQKLHSKNLGRGNNHPPPSVDVLQKNDILTSLITWCMKKNQKQFDIHFFVSQSFFLKTLSVTIIFQSLLFFPNPRFVCIFRENSTVINYLSTLHM